MINDLSVLQHEFYHALTEDDVPDEADNMKAKDTTVELFRFRLINCLLLNILSRMFNS